MKHDQHVISAEEIVDEILPLLRDYFVAQCQKRGNTIDIKFLSGQTVTLHVTA